MQKTIAVTDLKRRCHAIVDEVSKRHIPVVLTRGRRPQAALLAYEDFVRFQALVKDVHERFDRSRAEMRERTADLDEKEIAADVEAALAEVRG